MIKRAQVAAEARTWLGTPWQHQARLKGVGCDCVGLVIGVARDLGVVDADFNVDGYKRIPDGVTLMTQCHAHMTRIDAASIDVGDVLLMRFNGNPQHLAIVGDYAHGGLSIIHAYALSRAVVEHALSDQWRQHVVCAYKLPGVE